MTDNSISTIQEKIVGIEAVFSTLESGEKENAVGLLEDYLNRLRGQLKPETLNNSNESNQADDNISASQNNVASTNNSSTDTITGSARPKKRTSKRKADTLSKSLRKTESSEIVVGTSSRGRKRKLRKGYVDTNDEIEDDATSKKVLKTAANKTSKPVTSRKGRPVKKLKSKKAVTAAVNVQPELPSGQHSEIVTKNEDVKPEKQTERTKANGKKRKRKSRSGEKFTTKKKRLYVQKKTFVCKGCAMEFSHYKSLAVHLRSHSVNPMSCRLCRTPLHNEVHLLHHDCKRNRDKYTCLKCGETFFRKRECKEHMLEKHNMKYKQGKKNNTKHLCRFCNRTFLRKVSLFMHYKSHAETSFVCLKCGKICEDFIMYTDHMQEHTNASSYDCDKCGAIFDRHQQYLQHLSSHRKYDCNDCNMHFTRNKEIVRHRRIAHGDPPALEVRKFECVTCLKKFLRPMQLEIHMRIHTGERPLECVACQLFFRTTKALAKHRQTYNHCLKAGISTDEKKYLCSECGKAYFRKQALQRHIRYHAGEKPHTCQYCGYKCREQNNLKRHIALHFENLRNFICEVCGAAFHAKKTLEMHYKYKHTEIRDFPCPECPMSFKAKNALKRHVKTHEKTKDHKCWCGSAFGRMYNLRRHMRMVHGDEESLPPVRKVAVLDAADAIKQAIKSPPAKKRLYKPKQAAAVSVAVTSEPEAIIMNMVQNPLGSEVPHVTSDPIYNLHQQHTQLHLTEEQQHHMTYETVTIPQTMVTYHQNAPPPPPIGAETVIDDRVQQHQQQQQQQQQQQTDYYNPSLLEAQANDYNNPYMYIQNVLLPSVAMAGLLDLSHAPPPKQ